MDDEIFGSLRRTPSPTLISFGDPGKIGICCRRLLLIFRNENIKTINCINIFMLLRFAPKLFLSSSCYLTNVRKNSKCCPFIFCIFSLSRKSRIFFCNFLVNVTVKLYRYIHSGTGCCKKGHSPSQTIYKDPPKQKKILNWYDSVRSSFSPIRWCKKHWLVLI